MIQTKLPSWRPGPTRDAIEIFLDAAEMLPIEQRVAVFDVDGTLWCEKPRYTMVDFLVAELRRYVAASPELAERPEYRAALDWDRRGHRPARAHQRARRPGGATRGHHARGIRGARARALRDRATRPTVGVPLSQTRYRPMLELIAELRARHFSVYLVTGSGTEFIRAISDELFGVKPEGVVGSQVGYELDRSGGTTRLLRTKELVGDPNEGPAKISNIQRLLGRRPILAAGNSAGDAEMLEYAQAFDGPSLALLVDHDDAEREYEYQSVAGTFASAEPITATARKDGLDGRLDARRLVHRLRRLVDTKKPPRVDPPAASRWFGVGTIGQRRGLEHGLFERGDALLLVLVTGFERLDAILELVDLVAQVADGLRVRGDGRLIGVDALLLLGGR